jgi:hypothetical protein
MAHFNVIFYYEIHTGCFKKSFTNLKVYPEDMYSVLNCYNVAKDIRFYLVQLQFNVTSTGNAGCFKKSFTVTFKIFLWF